MSAPWYLDLMTAIQAGAFETAYAFDSNVTVEELHRWGRYAEPCPTDCTGWMMGHQWEDALFEDERRTREQGRIYRGLWLYENKVTGNVFICTPSGRELMARYDWPSARRYVDELWEVSTQLPGGMP